MQPEPSPIEQNEMLWDISNDLSIWQNQENAYRMIENGWLFNVQGMGNHGAHNRYMAWCAEVAPDRCIWWACSACLGVVRATLRGSGVLTVKFKAWSGYGGPYVKVGGDIAYTTETPHTGIEPTGWTTVVTSYEDGHALDIAMNAGAIASISFAGAPAAPGADPADESSVVGGPHVTNVARARLDIRTAGLHKLVQLPRLIRANERPDLRVDAEIRHLVSNDCSKSFVTSLSVFGRCTEDAYGLLRISPGSAT